MKLRYLYSFLAFVFIVLLAGCEEESMTMVLLDEKIERVEVGESVGAGQVNEEILTTFMDRKSIRIIEQAITTAVKTNGELPDRKPDFDLLVHYEKELPTHVIHIWLGEEDERTTLAYMVGEGQPYVTSGKKTNELRELLVPLME